MTYDINGIIILLQLNKKAGINMASNTVKKNVMLTLTLDEAKELSLFQDKQPYVSLAQYIKHILFKEISCKSSSDNTEADDINL